MPKLFESRKNVALSFNSELRYNFDLKRTSIVLTPGFFVNYQPDKLKFYDINFMQKPNLTSDKR